MNSFEHSIEQILNGGIITIVFYTLLVLLLIWSFLASAVKFGVYSALVKYDNDKKNNNLPNNHLDEP